MSVTLYHNPSCSKSRETLALLQEKGIEPEIIDYLSTPLNLNTLKKLQTQLGLASPRAFMRTKEALYKNLSLENATDAELLTAMQENPILIERPIVVVNNKAALGRPPENVLLIL